MVLLTLVTPHPVLPAIDGYIDLSHGVPRSSTIVFFEQIMDRADRHVDAAGVVEELHLGWPSRLEEIEMIRFAFGAKCGSPSNPPTRSAALASLPNSEASAATPMPVAVFPRNDGV